MSSPEMPVLVSVLNITAESHEAILRRTLFEQNYMLIDWSYASTEEDALGAVTVRVRPLTAQEREAAGLPSELAHEDRVCAHISQEIQSLYDKLTAGVVAISAVASSAPAAPPTQGPQLLEPQAVASNAPAPTAPTTSAAPAAPTVLRVVEEADYGLTGRGANSYAQLVGARDAKPPQTPQQSAVIREMLTKAANAATPGSEVALIASDILPVADDTEEDLARKVKRLRTAHRIDGEVITTSAEPYRPLANEIHPSQVT